MKHGNIEVICGNGKGKTALAVGKGVIALTRQKSVIMIQFLKGSPKQEGLEVLKCMEPQFKVFRFEKADTYFENLSQEEKQAVLAAVQRLADRLGTPAFPCREVTLEARATIPERNW